MNTEETKTLLGIMKMAYPNFYKDLSKADAINIVELWSMMFADEHPKIVTEAVKALICTLKYPPTIADVKEKIQDITTPQQETEMEAWEKVLKAIRNSGYNAYDEFGKLTEVVQKVIGSHNQLREWAMMESEKVNSVVQSNFMRSYTAKLRTERERSKLPQSAKDLLQSLNQRLSIDKGA